MTRCRRTPVQLLVADGDPEFAEGVSEAFTEDEIAATAESVTSVDEAVTRVESGDDYDGVVVGDALDDWTNGIKKFAEETRLTVVFVTDNMNDPNTVATAATSGADSCLPRKQPDELHKNIVDIVAASSRADSGQPPPSDFSEPETEPPGHPYRPVFENVTDGLVVQDPDTGRIIDVNERFCEMHGYERDEVLGESIDEVTAPDTKYSFESAGDLIEQAREGEPQLFEWRNQRKNGETFPVEVHLAVVRLHGSERVLASVREITERRRREREYEQIFNGVNDSITIHDPETAELLDVNETFCELLGYDREEILEMGIEGYSPAEQGFTMDEAREFVRDVVESDGTEHTEWAVETRDGETRWLEVTGTTVEIGGELRYVSIDRDITERKRREREYEQIFHAVQDAIILMDPETLDILDANESYLDMVGYDDLESVQEQGVEGLSATTEGYTVEEGKRIHRRVAETGEPEVVEWQAETREGERRWLEIKVAPAVIGGDEVNVAIHRDVTERRRTERRLRAIAEHIDEIIYLASADFSEILYINPAYEEIYGRPVDELSEDPTSFVEAAHPDDRDRYEADVERLIEDVEAGDPQDAYQGQYRIERNGEIRWVTVTRFPIENEHGTVDRIVGRVQDITERKRREREYEQIFNGVQGGITINDPETGEIVDVNDSMCELLGYDREEIVELGVEGISASERGFTGDRARELVAEVVETGDPKQFEWALETSDGETKWLDVRGTIAEIGGEHRYLSLTRDITERRRREREYEQIFDGVNDGITIHDPDTGEILDVNESYLDIFGYDDVETIRDLGIEGLSVTEEGFTGERGRTVVTDVASSGEPTTVEWHVETNQGEQRWLEATVAPAEIGGEKRVLGLHRDVTERKRREREFEQIFHSVNDGIAIQDPETAEVLDVNRSFVERLGYEDIGDVLERGYEGLAAVESGFTKDRAQELCHRVIETGDPETVEWQLETRAGDRLWIEATVSPAVIGGEDRIISIQRDITERRQLERRLRTISERIDEVIYLTNTDLSEVLYVNSAYSDIFGRSVEELYEDAEAYFDAVLPEDRESFRAAVDAMVEDIESGDPDDRYSFEYRIQRPDGEVRRLETTGYPVLTETDEPHQYVSITEDVTGRQTREQRLTVLNRVLRHNVRNALDVILAYADQIDDEEVRAQIRESATDLLEVSKKAREAEEVMRASTGPPESVDLTTVANTVADGYRGGDYSGDISLYCPDELCISARRTVIQKVLSELIENALIHSDKDTPRIELRVREHPDAAAEIIIADNGPGLPEDEQEILAAGTETQLKHGQGIGLWFVNWAVSQLGGDLYFQTNEPEGSIVTIRLYDIAT